MVINSVLFSQRDGMLSDWLGRIRQEITNRIEFVGSLDELPPEHLSRLVESFLVKPLVLHLADRRRETRTEQFRGDEFPNTWDFSVDQRSSYPKLVTRICIPFTGNPAVFRLCPNWTDHNPPTGEVRGSEVQFDLVHWGYRDDGDRLTRDTLWNIEALQRYTEHANKHIDTFNAGLSEFVTAAFNRKLDRLTEQHAIFDRLGIPEKPAHRPAAPASPPPAPVPALKPTRRQEIIQIIQNTIINQIDTMRVERMEVETLNQTNNNGGDVNNAVQPGL